jgi:hypothetical protein
MLKITKNKTEAFNVNADVEEKDNKIAQIN